MSSDIFPGNILQYQPKGKNKFKKTFDMMEGLVL
jgi:hypothetical protein